MGAFSLIVVINLLNRINMSAESLQSKLTKISLSLDKIKNQLPHVEEKSFDPELKHGIGLIQLKNVALMAHNANLLQIVDLKLRGESIKDSSTVDRLLETRVLMEQVKPLEVKLKYQMERLLKLTTTSNVDVNNESRSEKALSYKPNLSKLMAAKSNQKKNRGDNDSESESQFGEESGDDGISDASEEEGERNDDEDYNQPVLDYRRNQAGGPMAGNSQSRNRAGLERAKEHLRQKKSEKNSSGGGKYVPPKLVPMPYNQDVQDKVKKEEQREFLKRYNSSVMRELREEFSEAPREYSELPGGQAAAAKYRKVEKILNERQDYEEEFMTRLPPVKNMKKMTQVRGISEIDQMVGALGSLRNKARSSGGKHKAKGGKRYGGGKRKFKKR